jgi:hypothetical protein
LTPNIKEQDLLALYLGEIASQQFSGKNLEEIKKILLNNDVYDETNYCVFFHNSRTFVHSIAHQLGVGENYRKIVKKFGYLAALDLSLVA